MTELIVNLNNWEKSQLSINQYVILQLIYENLDPLDMFGRIIPEIIHVLDELEKEMYIKRLEDSIVVRQKGIDVFYSAMEKTSTFEDFWEEYHRISELPKTDRDAARKYWNSLRIKEKKLALERIQIYCDNNPKFRKKARTYLKDKNFNDEYNTVQEHDFTINA